MNRDILHPRHFKRRAKQLGVHIQFARIRFSQWKKKRKIIYPLLIVIAIIFIRRGIWGLLDVYLLPNSPLWSMIVSILLGLIILYLDNKKLKEISS